MHLKAIYEVSCGCHTALRRDKNVCAKPSEFETEEMEKLSRSLRGNCNEKLFLDFLKIIFLQEEV